MNDPATTRLAQIFLRASQALTDRMLDALKADPELAAKVCEAHEKGEYLALTMHFGGADGPRIELASVSDYGTMRRVASITAKADSVLRNH